VDWGQGSVYTSRNLCTVLAGPYRARRLGYLELRRGGWPTLLEGHFAVVASGWIRHRGGPSGEQAMLELDEKQGGFRYETTTR
jgi:hypothetical protein